MRFFTRTGSSSQALMVLVAVAMLVSGCSSAPGFRRSKGAAGAATHARWARARLVMIGFADAPSVLGAETTVRNPITKRVYLTGAPNAKAAAVITSRFLDRLRQVCDASVMFASRQEVGWENGVERKKMIELARAVKADGVIFGYLYLFKARQGKQYSVVEPAAVAFDVALLDARSSRVVWVRDFVETQQALNENLLSIGDFVKRRGRWLTAEELIADGIEKVLADFPARRR